MADTYDTLRNRFAGEVLTPGEPGYEEGRQLWNGMIDRRPEAIARCRGVADVVEAVRFAADRGSAVTVRGGGHNVAGTAVADDAFVIDMSAMQGIDVDPRVRRARVQGGATWLSVDRETQLFGLATPGGKVSDTGVAGLALGGGLGWLRRCHGLTCDNLVAARVVTAGGEVVTASGDEHPDLFWALRGGGGGVGVVTSFEFALHPVGPPVAACVVFHHGGERAEEALAHFRAFSADCPDEISALCILGSVPEHEHFPEAAWGQPTVAFAACHSGDPAEGERLFAPLREFSDPIADFSDTMDYVDVQRLFDEDYPSGELHYYWTSVYLRDLDAETARLLVDHASRRPSPLSTVDVWQLGGAIARVGPDATPVGHRDAPFLVGVEANWEDPADDVANLEWARSVVADLAAGEGQGTYLNFPGFFEQGEDVLGGSVDANYERLTEIKRRYDPHGLFRGTGQVLEGTPA